MCQGFGLIVTKTGRLLFVEPDENGDVHHHLILERAQIKENTHPLKRTFVRVEFPDWTESSFRWDEVETLPGWLDQDQVKERCLKLFRRIKPHYDEYRRIKQPAYQEYQRIKQTAHQEYLRIKQTAWAEYLRIRQTAYDDYLRIRQTAYDDYQRIEQPARAEYQRIEQTAYQEYLRIRQTAYQEYLRIRQTAWKELIRNIKPMTGYCGA